MKTYILWLNTYEDWDGYQKQIVEERKYTDYDSALAAGLNHEKRHHRNSFNIVTKIT